MFCVVDKSNNDILINNEDILFFEKDLNFSEILDLDFVNNTDHLNQIIREVTFNFSM